MKKIFKLAEFFCGSGGLGYGAKLSKIKDKKKISSPSIMPGLQIMIWIRVIPKKIKFISMEKFTRKLPFFITTTGRLKYKKEDWENFVDKL